MSRTSDRYNLEDGAWKRLAERDLDEIEVDIKGLTLKVDSEIFVQVNAYIDAKLSPVVKDIGEVKETSKWMLRTMMGLLVSVVILLAVVVATGLAK